MFKGYGIRYVYILLYICTVGTVYSYFMYASFRLPLNASVTIGCSITHNGLHHCTQYIMHYVIVKAPPRVCMENTARGGCREIHAAKAKPSAV